MNPHKLISTAHKSALKNKEYPLLYFSFCRLYLLQNAAFRFPNLAAENCLYKWGALHPLTQVHLLRT